MNVNIPLYVLMLNKFESNSFTIEYVTISSSAIIWPTLVWFSFTVKELGLINRGASLTSVIWIIIVWSVVNIPSLARTSNVYDDLVS